MTCKEHCCSTLSLLKKHKIRTTVKREAVLNEILEITGPFSVNGILKLVSKKIKIDQATVYRIINLFAGQRIIREVVNRDGFQFFELACQHKPEHPHFFCRECHKIDCLDELPPGDLMTLKKYEESLQIYAVQINLSGLCPVCQKRKKHD